jgi:hypothetical protein
MSAFRAVVATLACASALATAAPLTQSEIAELCASADDSSQCGRVIEETQLKRLPDLARRNGSALVVTLYPSGTATFTDSDDADNERSYSLWNYLDSINAVVLFTTTGDATGFTLLQRTTNRRTELPAEPVLAPDRQRLVTADICPTRCVNEVAVWRVTRDGVRKELVWTPPASWSDAAAKWKDADTLTIDYSTAAAPGSVSIDRKLVDPSWKRASP